MTPFAALAVMEKRAYSAQPYNPYTGGAYYPQQAGGYQQQPAYGAQQPAAPQQGGKQLKPDGKGGWTWMDTGELATDIALGWNPFTGVPWFGGKAIKNFYDGNWGQGLMNIGFGALSFLPGGGSAGAAIKGGIKGGTKLLPAGLKMMQTGSKLGKGTRSALRTGGIIGAAGGIGAQLAGQGAARAPIPQGGIAPQQFQPGDLIDNMAGVMQQ